MYQVHWLEEAHDELAAIWLKGESDLRASITSAAGSLEEMLSGDPVRASESREEGRRIMFAAPLGITFRIDDRTQTVFVLHVWQVRGRR